MLPLNQLLRSYESYPQIINNTDKLFADCTFDFDFTSLKNKRIFTKSETEDRDLLQQLANDGFRKRYSDNNEIAKTRLNSELEVIFKLGFTSYFLIAWDLVNYTMSRGIYHVGRGSGANSIVAYSLKITDVDPIDLNLYFERFINPKRTNPPDFDIDFSWKDRDSVQQYLFDRHGEQHTALLGAMSTFQGKSILRELGKVYGLPKSEIDEFIENPYKKENQNRYTKQILAIGTKLSDFPNIRSIHAGGVIISDLPISYYTALDYPPKGFATTQWDMDVAEEIGFEKLDILSQRGIGHINECVEIVAENHDIAIDIHRIDDFKKDEKIKHLLRNGETIGCFYVESPATRGLLKKLRCDTYLGLVAASSIIRPGVARSGMMREYIKRFNNPTSFQYIHPVMEEQLKETYGVMVYQEDVLKICHHFAGLDLADADVLRRVMSGKPRFRGEFNRIVETFFSNCSQRGYPEAITKEVWRQIESFAGYSFSKAHSASYAVESYQSLYLKAYYPLEFMTAVINNAGGFYPAWVYFHEAKRGGAIICHPCVNTSKAKSIIIGKNLYVGLSYIANLESQSAAKLLEERIRRGQFTGLQNFVARVPISLEQLILLIRIEAFRFTGKTKIELLWEAHNLLGKGMQKKNNQEYSLFDVPAPDFKMPTTVQSKLEDAYDEIELLGFPVSLSFFDMLRTSFRGEIYAKEMVQLAERQLRMLGLLVNIKYVRTVKKETMYMATFLDARGDFFDTVLFPAVAHEYPFKGTGVYLLLGKITVEFGHPTMQVNKMAKMPILEDPRSR